MKRVVVILMCVFLYIIDNTLLPFLNIKGYYPSALFIFLIFYSINNDYWEAIKVGVIAGLLQDLYFSQALGINPLVNMLTCVAAVKVGENIFKEKRLIPVMALFALSFLRGLCVFSLLYVIGLKADYKSTLYVSIYNAVLSIFMYKPLYKLLQKPFMKKQWKFEK
ncbi:MAG: rod shape-determining protein MreD [Bacillota bacterium]|nr:rod shape-determining protein MreD [Bacillota bacterium]